MQNMHEGGKRKVSRSIKAAALLVAFSGVLLAQPTLPSAVPMPTPEIQYLDRYGKPLSGSKLCTYAAGGSTPFATYTDSTAGTPNTNPITLDSAGRASVWIGASLYKFVLRTGGTAYPAADACTTGSIVWTQDNVQDTTLYFTNWVKTAGACTLITFTATGTGAVQRTCSAKLAETVTALDFDAKVDGTTDDQAAVQAAIDSVAAGGQVVLTPGTYALASGLSVTGPVKIHCQSKASIIKPKAGFSGTVISVTSVTQGFSLDGCTFDMTNAGSSDVLSLNGQTWPVVSDNKFTYPTGAAGTAIKIVSTGYADLHNNYFMSPGVCIDIDGDGGMEHQITSGRCDAAGVGVRVTRTTTTDVGGLMMSNFVAANSLNRASCRPYVFTSSAYGTAMPMQLSNIVGDNSLTYPAFDLTNINQVNLIGSWMTTGVAGQPAIKLTGTTEFKAVGNVNIQGDYGFGFFGVNTSVWITNNKIGTSTYDFYLDPSSTLTGAQFGNNIGAYTSNNIEAIVNAKTPGTIAGGSPQSTSGFHIWVNDANIPYESLKICTKLTGATNPCKYLTINTSGTLVLVADDASTPMLAFPDSGGLSIGQGAAVTMIQSAAVLPVTFGVIAANTCSDSSAIAFTDAAAGDSLVVTPSTGFMTVACGAITACLSAQGYVSAANYVKIRACNVSTTNSSSVGAQNFRIMLMKHAN